MATSKPKSDASAKDAKPTSKVKATTAAAAKPMVVRGHYVRTSAQKMRLVADQVRGMVLQDAIHQLPFLNKAAARMLVKILNAAAADAQHNYQYAAGDVRIALIAVNEGPKLKRYMPRAHGSSTPLLKRMCHLTITLLPVPGAKAGASKKAESKPTSEPEPTKAERKKTMKPGTTATATHQSAPQDSGVVKKIFNRKTG